MKASNTVVSNLGASKVRFASHTKPLARFVLYIEPLIHTALRMHAEKVDVPKRDAADFLDKLNASDYFLLALMSDAAVEVTQLN